MSESLPFVETLVSHLAFDDLAENPTAIRTALHALIAHCRQPSMPRIKPDPSPVSTATIEAGAVRDSTEQNERMRRWFAARTGLDDDAMLWDHMEEIDRLLAAAKPAPAAQSPIACQPCCLASGCKALWTVAHPQRLGVGWCDKHAPGGLPAPASASARAEAMRLLRLLVDTWERWSKHGIIVATDDRLRHAATTIEAARAVLALPEPDECAGLRVLRDWIDNLVLGSFSSQARGLILDKIDRLIAERGGRG